MFNKKIIVAILLITVFVVGLQIVQPVNAAAVALDEGSFKVNNKKIEYFVSYKWDKNKENKNKILIEFYGNYKNGKNFGKYYLLSKTKKNEIKSYSLTYDKKGNEKLKLLKAYKTTKNPLSFYKSTYKKNVINQVKKILKK